MDVILSLYVPGMFRGVWKNVLTLNVLYTDLSSLWMPGRTHYTHVCILCPHFECRDRYVWVGCVRPGIQSEDQNQFFTFKVRTFWQSEVKISVHALWLCALSSLCHNMGVGGMDVILSLYVPGMFRGVWKMSSLWMCYTQICPRFECRDEHTIHTCVYCVLTLNAGPGRGVWGCVCVCGVCVCVFCPRVVWL